MSTGKQARKNRRQIVHFIGRIMFSKTAHFTIVLCGCSSTIALAWVQNCRPRLPLFFGVHGFLQTELHTTAYTKRNQIFYSTSRCIYYSTVQQRGEEK